MMKPRCSSLLLALCIAVLAGCGGKGTTGGKDVASVPDVEDQKAGEVCLGCTPCSSLDDCGDPGVCVSKVACIDGSCQVEFKEEGTPCEEGCFVGGKCDGTGQCADTTLKDCPETDGSLCTEPKCDTKTGECVEEKVPDGEEPYAGSACWEGATCQDGVQDNSNATPTELALECESMSAELDPFGCADSYVCVGGEKGCKAVPKEDGAGCWEGDKAQGTVCTGQSCLNGECKVDHQFDAECTDEDFPVECDEQCRSCTELECHWIPDPDPVVPGNPKKKVRYCKAAATVGEDCNDGDECTLEDACGMGSQTDGPMGKETLGNCVSGEEKECSSYTCAPGTCDTETGECGFTSTDDEWCKSFSACLVNTDDNKCDPKHPDADEETGCVFVWKQAGAECEINDACVKAAACVEKENKPGQYYCEPTDEKTCPDDGNLCTEDKCEDVDGKATCVHLPDDTLVCKDGNKCTVNLCVDGVCVTTDESTCPDPDGNPCNGPKCIPETGECIQEPIGQGDACAWNGPCVTQVCNEVGQCVEAEMVSDGSVDVCNDGVDNDCDGKVDENCYLLWEVKSSAWVSGSGLSGTADHTLESVVGDTHSAPEFEVTATDGKYKLFSGLPTMSQE